MKTPMVRILELLSGSSEEVRCIFMTWLELALEGELLRRPVAIDPKTLIASLFQFLFKDFNADTFCFNILPKGVDVFQEDPSHEDCEASCVVLHEEALFLSNGTKRAFREIQAFIISLSIDTPTKDVRSLDVARLLHGRSRGEYTEKVRTFWKKTILQCVIAWYDPFRLEDPSEERGRVIIEALEAHPMDKYVHFFSLHQDLPYVFPTSEVDGIPVKRRRFDESDLCTFCAHTPCACFCSIV